MSLDAQPWTEPGPHTVAPGVHRVPLPMPNDGLHAVNVYVVEDGDGVVLIDAGWEVADARDHLERALRALGYGFADIHRFLITHMHRDHYTLAVALRREFGTPIVLGIDERPSLEAILYGGPDRQLGALVRWGAADFDYAGVGANPDGVRSVYEPPDEWLSGDTEIRLRDRTLRAVPTPGHTHGHVVFADLEASLLFSGDHVLPHITPSIGFEPAMAAAPLGDYLDSLQRMLALPDLRLLPAHGPVGGSVHLRTKELLAHHEDRLDATLGAVADGARTALQAASRLGWTRRQRALTELNAFNRFLAIGETAAHLDLLVTRGLLRCDEQAGVAHYTPAPR